MLLQGAELSSSLQSSDCRSTADMEQDTSPSMVVSAGGSGSLYRARDTCMMSSGFTRIRPGGSGLQ